MLKISKMNVNREKGIALIMSISILSLLIVVVTSFVFTTKVELTSANVYQLDSNAQKLSNDNYHFYNIMLLGGFAKRFSHDGYPTRYQQGVIAENNTTEWPSLYDYSSTRPNDRTPQLQTRLFIEFDEKRDSDALAYDFGFRALPDKIGPKSIRNATDRQLAWWPVFSFEKEKDFDTDIAPENDGSSVSSQFTNISGRTAWLTIDEGVKFDINGYLERSDTANPRFNNGLFKLQKLFERYNVSSAVQVEKSLRDLRIKDPNSNRYLPWDSWETIWKSKVFSSDPEYPKISEERQARNAYNCLNPNSYEQGNFYDVVPYKDRLENRRWVRLRQFFHKFHLAKLGEGSITVDQLITEDYTDECKFFNESSYAYPSAAYEAEDINYGNMIKDSKGVYTHEKTTFIPWLRYVSGSITDNTTHDENVRKQVAANLIDYSDADDKATTDYRPGSMDKFSYCGLEKVPYVARVTPIVQLTPSYSVPLNPDLRHAEIKCNVVLANIYENGKSSANVKIKAVVKIGDNASRTIEGTASISAANKDQGNAYITLETFNDAINFAGTVPNKIVFEKIAVEVDDCSDVAVIHNLGNDKNPELSTANSLYYLSVEYRDPRCNNFVDMRTYSDAATTMFISKDATWQKGNGNTIETAYTRISLDPEVNTQGLASYKRDNEPKAKDFDISTAIIRNAPMLSLWEVGAIHRGEPWRTLNLKRSAKREGGKYEGAEVLVETPSGNSRKWEGRSFVEPVVENNKNGVAAFSGRYEDGDIHMLSMLKTTKEAFRRPLINPWNPDIRFWQFIHESIAINASASPNANSSYYGSANGNPYYIADTKLTLGDIEKLILNRTRKDSLLGGSRAKTKATSYLDGFFTYMEMDKETAKGDFYQEELAGKIAEEMAIDYNYFRFISTAQSIVPLTAAQSKVIENLYNKDKNDPRVLNYVRLNYRLQNNSEREQGWFRITGEQKILGFVRRRINDHKYTVLEKRVLESQRN